MNQSNSPVAESWSTRDLATILFRHRGVLLGSTLLAPAAAIAWLVATPPTYEVSAAILLKDARATVPLTPTSSTPVTVAQVTEQGLNSEIEILRSRSLLEDVLRSLGPLDEDEPSVLDAIKAPVRRLLQRPRLPAFDRALLALQDDLQIEAVWRSNVINLTYRSDDPIWATRVLSRLTERYLERHAEINRGSETVSFFGSQLESAEQVMRAAEHTLEEFANATGLTNAPDARIQAVLQKLSEFEGLLGQAQAEVRQRMEQVTTLEARVAAEPERLASANRDLLDPTIIELRNQVISLRLRRDEVLQSFGPDSRMARDVSAQIGLVEGRLADAESLASPVEGTEANPVHQDLDAALSTAHAELEGARARHAALNARVAQFRGELDALTRQRFQFERLQRDAAAASEAYLLYLRKHEEARISAAMDAEKMVNVSVIREPERPLVPVAPRASAVLALALIVGIGTGLLLVFGLDFLASAPATGRDLERRTGLRHLASIPDSSSQR